MLKALQLYADDLSIVFICRSQVCNHAQRLLLWVQEASDRVLDLLLARIIANNQATKISAQKLVKKRDAPHIFCGVMCYLFLNITTLISKPGFGYGGKCHSPCQKSLKVASLNFISEKIAVNLSPTGDCALKPILIGVVVFKSKFRT